MEWLWRWLYRDLPVKSRMNRVEIGMELSGSIVM